MQTLRGAMGGRSVMAGLRVFLAALAIGTAGALVPVAASTTVAGCSATLMIWADAGYRNPDKVPAEVFCFGADVPSLNDVTYSANHLCPRAFPYPPVPGTNLRNTSWNDCISSFKFTASCHYRVRMFENDDYGSTFRGPWTFAWGSVRVPRMSDYGANDQVSSIRFTYRPTCPS